MSFHRVMWKSVHYMTNRLVQRDVTEKNDAQADHRWDKKDENETPISIAGATSNVTKGPGATTQPTMRFRFAGGTQKFTRNQQDDACDRSDYGEQDKAEDPCLPVTHLPFRIIRPCEDSGQQSTSKDKSRCQDNEGCADQPLQKPHTPVPTIHHRCIDRAITESHRMPSGHFHGFFLSDVGSSI